MKRLWQAAIEARNGGVRENDIFFDVTDTSSPYGEATVKNAYSFCGTAEGAIAVNPYYSYEAIFRSIIRPGKIPELTKFLCDLILHHLCETDCYSGMDLEAFYVRFLEKDIKQGSFGPEICLADFKNMEIRKISYYYLRLCRTGDYENCFCDILRKLYPNAWVNAREDGSLIVIVNSACSPEDERRIEAIKNIFLQAGRKLRLYWDIPPGIIECRETTIGNFLLF